MPEIVTYGEVVFGQGSMVQDNVVLGNRDDGKLLIGSNSVIRSGSVIYSNVSIGDGFKGGHNIIVRENSCIGDNVTIGTNAVIEGNCVIGSNVSLQTGAYITAYTVVEDHVFLGPYSVTTNDKYMTGEADLKGPIIKEGARIGANSVILPCLVIGENAVVGAGSVVTTNVLAGGTVAGNPAKSIYIKESF